MASSADQYFDLCNHLWQVWPNKAQLGRWKAMVLDVGRDMFVVRVGGLERRLIGMGLAVIPEKFVVPAPDLVPVRGYQNR